MKKGLKNPSVDKVDKLFFFLFYIPDNRCEDVSFWVKCSVLYLNALRVLMDIPGAKKHGHVYRKKNRRLVWVCCEMKTYAWY